MKTNIFILISITYLLYSCGTYTPPRKYYEYHSPSFGAIKTYTVKPVYKGSKEKAIYISANFSSGKQTQHERTSKDQKKAGSFSIHRSITDKHYNFHYGLGASFGQYEFGNNLNNFIKKGEKSEYHTINLKSGINYNQSTKYVDFRIVGLELNYNYQKGDFQEKLSKIPEGNVDPGYYHITVKKPKTIFSYNLNTEVVVKFNNDNNMGCGIFFGGAINASKSFPYTGVTLFYTHKNITFSMVGETFNGASNKTSSTNTKFGITYKIFNKKKKMKKKNNLKKIVN